MQVILLRHGTRSYGIGDTPLNSEGIQEAEALAQDPSFSETLSIECSPKQRAQMTVGPLAKTLDLEVSVHSALDQQNTNETLTEFQHRIERVINEVGSRNHNDKLVLCSHSDWLSLAVQIMPGLKMDPRDTLFSCAEHKLFEVTNGIWRRL